VADFKKTFLGLNPGKAPLQSLLLALGDEPYRSFVEYRIKDHSAKDLQNAAIDNWWLVLDDLGIPRDAYEASAKVSAVLRSRILVDASYWQGPQARTCREAFADILSIVDEEMEIPIAWLQPTETLTEQQQRSLMHLWFFATDIFAGSGAESKLLRRNMGIRKGLFG